MKTCLEHKQQPLDDQPVNDIVCGMCLHSVQAAAAEELTLHPFLMAIAAERKTGPLEYIVLWPALATACVLCRKGMRESFVNCTPPAYLLLQITNAFHVASLI